MPAAKTLLAALAAVAVAGGIGWAAGQAADDDTQPRGLREFSRPDEPPPEYLYLDTARVLAYLGQVDGGLTNAERRSFQETRTVSGKLAVTGVDASASDQRVGSVEQDVTAGTTDRFYRLLGALIDGGPRGQNWLFTIDADVDTRDDVERVRARFDREVQVGAFVRVKHAHAFLPPYTAVYRKTSYALNYLGGDVSQPRRPLSEPFSGRVRHAADRYRKEVRRNPRIPMVVPVFDRDSDTEPVTFVVPVRYAGLTSEPSSLAGEMTIVGKVIYVDSRLRSTVRRDDPQAPYWIDLETVHRFAPALENAERPLLRLLRLEHHNRSDLPAVVRRSVTFSTPVVVLLPIAIYQ
jgi:hypothetical protein